MYNMLCFTTTQILSHPYQNISLAYAAYCLVVPGFYCTRYMILLVAPLISQVSLAMLIALWMTNVYCRTISEY